MNALGTRNIYPTANIEASIHQQYAGNFLYIFRGVKKCYYHSEAMRLDIQCSEICRSYDLVPSFLWFKTANSHLSSSSVYKDCQRRLLNVEIDWKYRESNKLKKIYQSSLNLLRELSSTDFFDHLYGIILFECSHLLKRKENTLNRKLSSMNPVKNSTEIFNPKAVTNLSSRVLSQEETLCLANGLDYSLRPKDIDSMNIAGNVETFFHRVTDVFQHHKKFMNEHKENEAILESDMRVLNTKELSLASDLSSFTKSFLQKVNRRMLQKDGYDINHENYRKLLQKLKKDTSLIITRPDKGRGVVLTDIQDYVNKMLTILNDSSKFSSLSEDPTLQRENSLTTLLRRLHDEGRITDQFYYSARPTGSNPGRLYGLPKVHKKKYQFDQFSHQSVPLTTVLQKLLLKCYRI